MLNNLDEEEKNRVREKKIGAAPWDQMMTKCNTQWDSIEFSGLVFSQCDWYYFDFHPGKKKRRLFRENANIVWYVKCWVACRLRVGMSLNS